MRKALIILSAPQMYGFLRGHAQRLRALGYSTVVVSAPSERLDVDATLDGASTRALSIARDIAPLSDLRAFLQLCLLLVRERPDVVISMGPKANLLGNIAAWLVDVPRRVSLYVGIRQETMTGLAARIVDLCDIVALGASTHVLAISPSLGAAMVRRGLVRANRVQITGHGTTNGIPAADFPFDRPAFAAAAVCREGLRLPPHVPVVGFVGRVTEDKGLLDIAECYQAIRRALPDAHLVLVGQDEVKTLEGRAALDKLACDPQVRVVGPVADVRPYVHLFWVHLFPSYREGFGNATAEAAALAVPTVGYKVTGVMDAISDGETGATVAFGDRAALVRAVLDYLNAPLLRREHGLAARRRTLELYHPDVTWAAFLPALGLARPEPAVSCPPAHAVVSDYLAREEMALRSRPPGA